MPYPRRLLWDILPQNTPNSQNLILRCPPTDFTEFTEFVSVGMAGMPYPPTSVCIRAHLWEALLCQKFLCVPCVLWEYLFSHGFHRAIQMLRARFVPTDFTDLHRYLGCAVLPQNSQNSQNLAAWVWQECHTLLHLCHLWESFLCKGFCVFRAFRGSFFTACSVEGVSKL